MTNIKDFKVCIKKFKATSSEIDKYEILLNLNDLAIGLNNDDTFEPVKDFTPKISNVVCENGEYYVFISFLFRKKNTTLNWDFV